MGNRHAFATLSFISETFLFLYVGMDALDIEKWKIVRDVIRDGRGNDEVNKINRRETRDLTWKTIPRREGKTTGASQLQSSLYRVRLQHRGFISYPEWRLTGNIYISGTLIRP